MRRFLVSGLLLAAACGAPAIDETTEEQTQALAADPWQYIFAARPDGTGFIVNPVGTGNVVCLDSVARAECPVNQINLAGTGLSSTVQQTVRDRIAQEPVSEGRISVLLKGTFVRVRDHRTTPATITDELRVTAAYRSPTVRDHAIRFGYVAGEVQGIKVVRPVNTDFLSKVINLPYRAQFRWVGPGTAPSSYPVDSFLAWVAARTLAEGSPAQVEFDVDQRFTRW